MKIAIIAPTFIPAKRANTLQVMKMTDAIMNLGHQVRLAVPEASGRTRVDFQRWEDTATYYGISNKFPIDYLSAKSSLRRYDYAWSAVRWARQWEADLIYTRLPQAAALAAFQGYKTILEMHDFPQGFFGPVLFSRFLQGEGAIRLVVISEALTADLHEKFGSPEKPPFTQIIPDGVDLIRYSDLPDPDESRSKLLPELQQYLEKSESHQYPERFTAGYTGHLYPGRGVHLILELAKRLPNLNFLIVGGENQDVNRVKDIVDEQGLQNVIITGFIPNAELPLYQAACDVLLMPYQRQVAASSGGDIARYLSPMKLFEYMACGRAICSSDLPVLREVLSEEIAVLLSPEDIDSWVAALRDLQDNPARRKSMANKARQAVGQYSWDKRAQKILEGI
jgi:glycosyltransferase involved in cell wall biosynthesis